jgi:ribosomal-protein-serine acetyltransferase
MLQPPSSITRGDLEFRQFKRRDLDALATAVTASLPELIKWLPWATAGYNRVDGMRFLRDSISAWRDHRAYDFAIRPTNFPEEHWGNVSIWSTSQQYGVGEVGYWVRTDKAHQGIGTAATKAMLELGFGTLKMHRIILRIAVGNGASERIAEKLGFTKEGVLREVLIVNGKRVDHVLYSILRHEFLKANAGASS